MTSVEPGRTYHTLDGLRGVAALIVVTRHVGQMFPTNPFPDSFLAVDLFFLLSGFVIASAYETRLREGLGLGRFLRVRLVRLYPLYAIGLALGLAGQLLQRGGTGHDGAWLLQAAVVGLLMAPAVPPLPMGSSALDGPTWTLLPELLVNLLYARLVRRLSTPVVWAMVAAGAGGLVWSERNFHTLDGGWWVGSFPLVAARLGFSFFLGVAFFRLKPLRRTGPWAAWATLLALAGVLALPPGPRPQLFELALVMGVFPLLTWVAVQREPGPFGRRVFAWLGLSSYAVYVIHQPLGVVAGALLQPLGVHPSWPAAIVFLAATGAIATVLDAVYDRPVRRWLGARLARRPAAAASQAPAVALP